MNPVLHLHRALVGAAIAAVVAVPLVACHAAGTDMDTQSVSPSDLALIQNVMNRVERSYVHPVKTNKLVDTALKGMLTGLDPHSDYMTEQEYREMLGDTRGRFGGIGIDLTVQNGVPKVISPIDGTPAARAGLKPGDFIVKIGTQPTDNMGVEEIVHSLRGDPGTRVTVTIARGAKPPFPVTLTRAIIHVTSVKSSLQENRVGYVRISTFTETTPGELDGAIAQLKKRAGGRLNGFVLDLRNDPGGLVNSAVDVAGDFLDGGTVVTTRGRESNDDRVYAASGGPQLLDGTPMVVLINGASASASEIVAGALHDRRRATIMGTRSFGKGSVQTIIPIEGHGALRLTTALYYTPSGQSIQDRGITPDIVVTLPKNERVANAVVFREADLRGALKNAGSLHGTAAGKAAAAAAAAKASKAEEEAPIDPSLIGTAKDYQLQAALAHLRRVAGEGGKPSKG
jgi:carboxyl-terminal processing protease